MPIASVPNFRTFRAARLFGSAPPGGGRQRSRRSDRMIEMGVQIPGRVSVPISDEDAHATYWVACRASDQSKYRAIFNAVRGYALRH